MLLRLLKRRRIRPVDRPTTRQPSVRYFAQTGCTKVDSGCPDNPSSFHNPASRTPGYQMPEELVVSISECHTSAGSVVQIWSLGSPVHSNDLGAPTYLTPPPPSSPKPSPKSPRITYAYPELSQHAFFRNLGHHLRCHRWHCLR